MTNKNKIIIALVLYIIFASINYFVLGNYALVYAFENFFMLIFLLYVFVGNPIKDFFANRSSDIIRQIDQASESFEKAYEAKQQIENKLTMAPEEKRTLLNKINQAALNEEKELIEEGETLNKKIINDAHVLAKNEVIKTKVNLRRFTANRAAHLAEKKIIEKITPQDHERLGNEFIKRIKEEKAL
ncbi:MAG: hypothetical protein ABII18_03410 [bacterium]|nr:hypothetical protein [bacterium]